MTVFYNWHFEHARPAGAGCDHQFDARFIVALAQDVSRTA